MVEMCLHRTKAEQVAQVADKLLTLGRTPDSFLENYDLLRPSLETLGLRWRFDNLVAAAKFVEERLDGRVPDNWQDLIAIPGVGDYIASAVLCFAYNRSSVLVDTNTERISRRLLGEDSKQPDWRLRLALHELAGPQGADVEWNQALLDLGALTCRSRAPKCGDCPVRPHCITGIEKSTARRVG
jgi:A/G-specific adenine glycosylase